MRSNRVLVSSCCFVCAGLSGMESLPLVSVASTEEEQCTSALFPISNVLFDANISQGTMDHQEDRLLMGPLNGWNARFNLLAVCDGHCGSDASDFVSIHLPYYLEQTLRKRRAVLDRPSAVKAALHETYQRLEGNMRSSNIVGGTTAVATLIDRAQSRLYVANVGDSRAILGSFDSTSLQPTFTQLSRDHKPSDPFETQRLKAAGTLLLAQVVPRWAKTIATASPARLSCGLAVSRVLGDFQLKDRCAGLISVPEVSCRQLTPRDRFVVVASDGIWDMMTNEGAGRTVMTRWMRDAAYGIVWRAAVMRQPDNMSALVAYLVHRQRTTDAQISTTS